MTKNKSGPQIAEEYYQTFLLWTTNKTTDDYRQYINRATGELNRREIARECDFRPQVLKTNSQISELLKSIEDDLREKGILPQKVDDDEKEPRVVIAETSGNVMHAVELKRLQEENQLLKIEKSELEKKLKKRKEELKKCKKKLKKHGLVEKHLGETMKVLR